MMLRIGRRVTPVSRMFAVFETGSVEPPIAQELTTMAGLGRESSQAVADLPRTISAARRRWARTPIHRPPIRHTAGS